MLILYIYNLGRSSTLLTHLFCSMWFLPSFMKCRKSRWWSHSSSQIQDLGHLQDTDISGWLGLHSQQNTGWHRRVLFFQAVAEMAPGWSVWVFPCFAIASLLYYIYIFWYTAISSQPSSLLFSNSQQLSVMELFLATHPPHTTYALTFKFLAVIPHLNPSSDTRIPGARLCFTHSRWWQAWQDRAGAWQGKAKLAKILWLLLRGLLALINA